MSSPAQQVIPDGAPRKRKPFGLVPRPTRKLPLGRAKAKSASPNMRKSQSVSDQPSRILGGVRGRMTLDQKLTLLKKFGNRNAWYVDGATEKTDKIELGQSIHAISGPAALGYGAFSFEDNPHVVRKIGDKYVVLANHDKILNSFIKVLTLLKAKRDHTFTRATPRVHDKTRISSGLAELNELFLRASGDQKPPLPLDELKAEVLPASDEYPIGEIIKSPNSLRFSTTKFAISFLGYPDNAAGMRARFGVESSLLVRVMETMSNFVTVRLIEAIQAAKYGSETSEATYMSTLSVYDPQNPLRRFGPSPPPFYGPAYSLTHSEANFEPVTVSLGIDTYTFQGLIYSDGTPLEDHSLTNWLAFTVWAFPHGDVGASETTMELFVTHARSVLPGEGAVSFRSEKFLINVSCAFFVDGGAIVFETWKPRRHVPSESRLLNTGALPGMTMSSPDGPHTELHRLMFPPLLSFASLFLKLERSRMYAASTFEEETGNLVVSLRHLDRDYASEAVLNYMSRLINGYVIAELNNTTGASVDPMPNTLQAAAAHISNLSPYVTRALFQAERTRLVENLKESLAMLADPVLLKSDVVMSVVCTTVHLAFVVSHFNDNFSYVRLDYAPTLPRGVSSPKEVIVAVFRHFSGSESGTDMWRLYLSANARFLVSQTV